MAVGRSADAPGRESHIYLSSTSVHLRRADVNSAATGGTAQSRPLSVGWIGRSDVFNTMRACIGYDLSHRFIILMKSMIFLHVEYAESSVTLVY